MASWFTLGRLPPRGKTKSILWQITSAKWTTAVVTSMTSTHLEVQKQLNSILGDLKGLTSDSNSLDGKLANVENNLKKFLKTELGTVKTDLKNDLDETLNSLKNKLSVAIILIIIFIVLFVVFVLVWVLVIVLVLMRMGHCFLCSFIHLLFLRFDRASALLSTVYLILLSCAHSIF